jgi:hypothetical protein
MSVKYLFFSVVDFELHLKREERDGEREEDKIFL